MEKPFRLPKIFGEKWIMTLRSGEYNQGSGRLLKINPDGEQKFCCLGVAAHMCGVDDLITKQNGYLSKWDDKVKNGFEIPDELTNAGWDEDQNFLPQILMCLNDGITYDLYINDIGIHNLTFRNINLNEEFSSKDTESKIISLNFMQIADFIEDNVEFY